LSENVQPTVLHLADPAESVASLTDAELAARVCSPSEGGRAFRELYARHGRDLLAMLMARFPHCAEDASQVAWLKAFEILQAGPREMPNFRGWLWTIARNQALDAVRRSRGARLDAAEEPADLAETALEQLAHGEREQAMRDCVKQLREQQPDHAAVVAAFLQGEEVVPAAARLGISRNNFDKRKQRAMQSLRVCVEGKLG